ncbi:MAG: hypothetical protein GX851_01400 [Clostridiales bacterium]|nr:hypothetical protein [Clostridiales bacterium]
MKKLIRLASVLTAFMLVLACVPVTSTAVTAAVDPPMEPYSAGDVDGDGYVTAKDARIALRIAASLEAPANEQAEYAADVDWVLGISANDARSILRAATKLSSVDIPSSKEGIVNYFNSKSNDVKTLRPGITRVDTSTVTDIGSANSFYNALFRSLLDDESMKPQTQTTKASAGKSLINKYPVAGKAWSSRLIAADVSTATIAKVGETYVVTIKLTDRTYTSFPEDPAQTPHGRAFELPSKAEIESTFSGLEGGEVTAVRPSYKNAQIKLIVDAATGNAISSTYDIDMTFDMDITMSTPKPINVFFVTHNDTDITLGEPAPDPAPAPVA